MIQIWPRKVPSYMFLQRVNLSFSSLSGKHATQSLALLSDAEPSSPRRLPVHFDFLTWIQIFSNSYSCFFFYEDKKSSDCQLFYCKLLYMFILLPNIQIWSLIGEVSGAGPHLNSANFHISINNHLTLSSDSLSCSAPLPPQPIPLSLFLLSLLSFVGPWGGPSLLGSGGRFSTRIPTVHLKNSKEPRSSTLCFPLSLINP